jgi:molecular chaperone DnaJ
VDVKTSYRLLRLKEGASLDDVKKSFRQLAFQLHPDLNPGDPHASRHFQRINEAYVTLKRHLEALGPEAAASSSAQAEPPPGAQNGASAGPSAGAGAAGPFGASGPDAGKARPSEEKAKPRPEPRAAETRPKREKPEDILQDILKDPFARQVFEDIYSQIRKTGGKGVLKVEKPKKVKKLRFQWGEKNVHVDLTDGLWAGAKNWFRSWMDEEQSVNLPPTMLKPGSRVRIHLRQGWTGKQLSVEVALPPDYIVGRPIRLKGLGRKFGPWIGDLYVRLYVK